MFNSGYKGIRAVDGSGIVTLKDVEVQQTSLQPKITSWSYTNGAYVPYPDTAIVGGETIVIYGSGFQNGANVYIGSTAITSTRLDQNRITFTAPSQSAGSYVLYVINPNGNAAVYAPGIYYNSYPVWNTTVYANTFIAPTSSVSFNLNATDSANLTFTLQSGSLPTGLTLYPSGLISGTTTVANTTVYTFTAVATDPFNQAAQSSIIYTITCIFSDPYFNQTALLLNGETNTNTYIQDTSNNNFALTVNGSATSNRFNPLWGNGYYGNYFDGSTGGINTPVNPTALQLGSNNFTIEAWINLSTTPSNFIIIFGCESLTYDGILFGISTSNTIQINISSNGSTYNLFNSSTFATVIKTNTWTHVALVRNNGTLYAYINGVQDSTTYNISTNSIYFNSVSVGAIGIRPPTQSLYFPGYISNLRVVNGTAVYTSNFTPSTTPLTAIANTTLLTCQSANFVDNSTNAFTLTPAGTVKVVPNQPFATVPSTATITTNNAGYYSGYFDGSTGYLSVPGNAYVFGTNSFTVECWINPSAYGSSSELIDNYVTGPSGTVGQWQLQLNTNGTISFIWAITTSSASNITTTATAPLNTWTHVAIVRAGTGTNQTTIYVNGVANVTGTISISIGVNALSSIGRQTWSNNYYYAGYMSNVRVVNGTAVYTSNFTPSTTPLTAIANTSLLTFQNSMIVDNSTNAFTITPSGKVIVSQNQPFASPTTSNTAITPSVYGSSLFDGSSSYLALGGQSAFAFGTGNFTIECWIYTTTASSTQEIYSSQTNGSYTTAPDIYIQSSKFYVQVGSSNLINGSGPTTVISNTWYHVALVKNGSTTTLYVNGVYEASFSDSNTYVIGANRPVIGIYGLNVSSYPFSGYISNMRVVKGTAVYTSNFIPPTAPLTAIANTSLLTLQNKNGANNNTFYDDSVNNFAITRTGTPTQGTFTPFSQTGWSNYFDGSTGYFYMGTASNWSFLNNGTTNYTIECWVYPTSTSNEIILGTDSTVYGAGMYVALNSTNAGDVALGINNSNPGGLGWTTNTGGWVPQNTWTHIAVCIAVNTLATQSIVTIYTNGVSRPLTLSTIGGSPDGWSSSTSNSLLVGACQGVSGHAQSASYLYGGYISNLRITKSIVYASAFTPPTAPLTAIANTALLTCQSNRFIDNSTNAYAITPSGTVQVQAFSPFAPGVSYSSANNGGSMYFNGSTDYLNTASVSPLQFGTNSFTIELWIYPLAGSLTANLFDFRTSAVNGLYPTLLLNAGVLNYYTNSTTQITGGPPAPYAWSHVALVRNSTSTILYLNGVQTGSTYADSNSYLDGTSAPVIGSSGYSRGSSYFNGYISNLRMVNGTAVYTSAFTPPTAPLTPTASTSLLLLGTNTGIQDQTGKNDIITVGSAKTQSNTVKYGTGAMYFDGSTSYAYLPPNNLYSFGSGDFTIEAWVNLGATSSIQPVCQSDIVGVSTNNKWFFSYTSSTLVFNTHGSGGFTNSIPWTPTIGTWYHVAVTRASGTMKMFINGVSGTVTTTGTPSGYSLSQNGISVGGMSTPYYLTGYIDDLRITNGVARYTANFTPPTVPDLTQ